MLLLHEGAQAFERVVPLAGDAVEIGAHLADPVWLECVVAFASDLRGTHEAGLFQHMQMFGDGLPGQDGAYGKPRYRALAPVAEGCQQ